MSEPNDNTSATSPTMAFTPPPHANHVHYESDEENPLPPHPCDTEQPDTNHTQPSSLLEPIFTEDVRGEFIGCKRSPDKPTGLRVAGYQAGSCFKNILPSIVSDMKRFDTDIAVISELGIVNDSASCSQLMSTLRQTDRSFTMLINGDPTRRGRSSRGNGLAIIARGGVTITPEDSCDNPRLIAATTTLGSNATAQRIMILGIYGPSGCTSAPSSNSVRAIETQTTSDIKKITERFNTNKDLTSLVTIGDVNSISSPLLDTINRPVEHREESIASTLDSLMIDTIRYFVPTHKIFTRPHLDRSAAYIDRIYFLTKSNTLKIFSAGIDLTTMFSDHHVVYTDFIGAPPPSKNAFENKSPKPDFDSQHFKECARNALDSQSKEVRDEFQETINSAALPFNDHIEQLVTELEATITQIDAASALDKEIGPSASENLQKLRTVRLTEKLDFALSYVHGAAQAVVKTQGPKPATNRNPRDLQFENLWSELKNLQKRAASFKSYDCNLTPASFNAFIEKANGLAKAWTSAKEAEVTPHLSKWTTNPFVNLLSHARHIPPNDPTPKELGHWRQATRGWLARHFETTLANCIPVLPAPRAIKRTLEKYNVYHKNKRIELRRKAHAENCSDYYKFIRMLKEDSGSPQMTPPPGATSAEEAVNNLHTKYSASFGVAETTKVNDIIVDKSPPDSSTPQWHFRDITEMPEAARKYLAPALERGKLTFSTEAMHGKLSEEEKEVFGDSSKAPGPSRIHRSTFAYMPKSWRSLYLLCIEICVRIAILPKFARTTLIFLLPKPDGGERPLTLLEDFTKCVERILKRRLNLIRYHTYRTGDLLNPHNVAYEKGRGVSAMIIPLQVAIEDALKVSKSLTAEGKNLPTEAELRRAGAKPIVLFAWDFLKFFDLVQAPIPFALMRHRGINTLTVMFLEHMYDGMTHQIIAPWGTTDPIVRFRGICQGAIFSDLIARFAVDPFYCYLNERFNEYFTLEADGPMVLAKAYSDDGAAVFSSELALSNWLAHASQLAAITHLGFKPKALAILANFKLRNHHQITYPGVSGAITTSPIPAHGPHRPIKVLGITLSLSNPIHAQEPKYARSISWMLRGLRSTSFSAKEMTTAIRAVLIPTMSYFPLGTGLSNPILHQWDTTTSLYIKSALGLPPTTSRSFVFVSHKFGGLGCKSFSVEYRAATARELMYELAPGSPSAPLLTWKWDRLAAADGITNPDCLLTDATLRLADWGTYLRSSGEMELNAIVDTLATMSPHKMDHNQTSPWSSTAAHTANKLREFSAISPLACKLRKAIPTMDCDFWMTVCRSSFWQNKRSQHAINMSASSLAKASATARDSLRKSWETEMYLLRPYSLSNMPLSPSISGTSNGRTHGRKPSAPQRSMLTLPMKNHLSPTTMPGYID